MGKIAFDPDELNFSKEQILDILDAIIEGWQRNTKANWGYILAAKSFRAGVQVMHESLLVAIWSRVFRALNEIQNASQLRRLAGEQTGTQFLYEEALRKIRSPEFWRK